MLQTTDTFIWPVVSARSTTSPFCFAVYRWAAAGAAHARASVTARVSLSDFISEPPMQGEHKAVQGSGKRRRGGQPAGRATWCDSTSSSTANAASARVASRAMSRGSPIVECSAGGFVTGMATAARSTTLKAPPAFYTRPCSEVNSRPEPRGVSSRWTSTDAGQPASDGQQGRPLGRASETGRQTPRSCQATSLAAGTDVS